MRKTLKTKPKTIMLCSAIMMLPTLSACSAVQKTTAPPPLNQVIPSHFDTGMGGFFNGGVQIKKQGDALLYITRKKGKETQTTLYPSMQDWADFYQRINALKVFDWEPDHMNMQVSDGMQWHIKLQYHSDAGRRSVNITGSNSYPLPDGRPNNSPDRTPTFNAYTDAVQKLVGGRNFP